MNSVDNNCQQKPVRRENSLREAYLDRLANILKAKDDHDPDYYLHGVHPQYNTQLAYGWIIKGGMVQKQ